MEQIDGLVARGGEIGKLVQMYKNFQLLDK